MFTKLSIRDVFLINGACVSWPGPGSIFPGSGSAWFVANLSNEPLSNTANTPQKSRTYGMMI